MCFPIKDKWNESFLSKNTTNAVKGIFIVIVFINHISEYYTQVNADMSAWYDNIFFLPSKACGQLMVVMFLFYSGYGVMESIKKKGKDYINSIPIRRVLNTLLNFDIAVLIFTIVSLMQGMYVTLEQFVLSLTGWESVGNSNWYIFVIVGCYALTYISFKTNPIGGEVTLCFAIVVFAMILSLTRGTWWYNTMFAYAAGVLFSEHKDTLVVSMKKNYGKWFISICSGMGICLSLYLIFYIPFKSSLEQLGALVFNVMSVFFALFVVITTMKVKIGNNILIWLGTNLFPIYIYQRLSMMTLTELYPNTLVVAHPYIFLILCFLITISIAYCYKWFSIKLK